MQKTIDIILPKETVNYIERIAIENSSYSAIISTIINMFRDDPTILESETFKKYHDTYMRLKMEFDLIKSKIDEDFVPKWVKKYSYDWKIIYIYNTLSINVTNDGEIVEDNNE